MPFLRDDAVRMPFDLVGIEGIALSDLGLAARVADFLRDGLQRLRMAAGQKNLGALPCECLGDGPANGAASAVNDSRLPSKKHRNLRNL
jgi:hypothetical protein